MFMRRLSILSKFLAMCCLGIAWALPAQIPDSGRVSEEEVERQTRFIEADRDRILGNFEEAAEQLIKLRDEEPDNPVFAFSLARVYAGQEQFVEAVTLVREALEQDPENTWYLEYLAGLYEQQEANRQAAEVYQELLSQHPDNEEYYNRQAYFLVRAGAVEDALRVYDRLEERFGLSEELIRRKHALYLGLGDKDKAAAQLQRLIEAFPTDTEYRHMLATFYEEMDEPEKAREVYARILEIDPDDAAAQLSLAGEAQPQGGDQEYLNSLRPVFERPDVELDIKIQRLIPIVQKVAETGDVALGDAALELTGILDQVHPDAAKVSATEGDLFFYTGRYAEAIGKYETTLSLDDTVFPVWEQLLNALFHEGRTEALFERAEEAMDLFPNKPIAYYYYGVASRELDDPDEALYAFEQALLMSAADPSLTFLVQAQLGQVYDQLGQFERSEAAFAGALEIQPGQPDVLRAYAASLAERSASLDKALDMAGKALEARPDDPVFLDTYGWVLYKQKKFRQAENQFREALQTGGDQNPVILEHFGDLNFQLGEEEEAIRYWNLAQEKGADSPLLEKKINDKQLYE